MARAMPFSSSGPLAQAPLFARDAHELRAVLAAQAAEADALKVRLAHGHREYARLQQRLRDAEGELAVAAEATTSATERLGCHAMRHGLVLAAGVERIGAERATVEHELQRVEAALHERDLEIRFLRKQAHDLEAAHHQYSMELKGLEVAYEATSSRARAAGSEVSALLQQLTPSDSAEPAARLPSQREVQKSEEVDAMLAAKYAEHQQLRQRAEATAQEAKRLEEEEHALAERVRAFQLSLREKQEQMQSHDERFHQEGALLREHCQKLRRELHNEQRDGVGVDQRAVLHPQCGAEAEGVKREVGALMETIPRLAATLQARGLSVCSPEVPEDHVDKLVHAYLNTTEAAAGEAPPLLWRLSPGEYLLSGTRVGIFEAQGGLVVGDGRGGGAVPLAHILRRRPRPAFGHQTVNV